jgi:methionine-rich copper-binding protein CopC
VHRLLSFGALALAAASPALAQDPHAGHGAHAGHDAQAGAADHAAHGVVTSPADGAMTDGSPDWFTATFPHAMTLKAVAVSAEGQAAVTVPVAVAAATTRVSADLPTLAPGNHVLNWIAEGADGHRMTGVVRFMVH